MLKKYFVRVSYPDITVSGCPDIQTSFQLYDYSGKAAAERARQFAMAIVKDMLKHNKINPYIIDLVAADMVVILSVKALEDGKQ